MQNKILKIVSIAVIVILMTITSNLFCYAKITEENNKTSIEVKGIEAGVTVTAYKIADINYDYTANQPSNPEYTWNTDVSVWIETNYSSYLDTESFSEVQDNEVLEAFYSDLALAIKQETIDITTLYTSTATGDISYPVETNSEVTFSDVEMGLYLILIENGYMVYTPSVINAVPEYDEESGEWILSDVYEAEVKSTVPLISKTVTDDTLSEDSYSTNDTIPFTIIADIPHYAENSASTIYSITDTLYDGLKLDTSSIRIYGVTAQTVTELDSSAYTLEISDTSYTIDFIYTQISKFDSIKITYDGSLLQSNLTIIGENGNTSSATLTYSNNPYTSDTYITISDNAIVYTYSVEIIKIDKEDETKVIEGTEFELSDGNNTLFFIKVDGVYYLASDTDENATEVLVTDANGEIKINGLDEGTYYLKETKAAEDYIIDTSKITIEIKDLDNEELDGILENDTDGTYSIIIKNTKSFILPITGGIGGTVFVIIGIAIIALGIFLKKAQRRKENKQEKQI